MELSKLVRLVDRKVMKHYFSGENLNCLCRYYYVSRTCILSLAEDYKSGKIDIFNEKEDNDEVFSQRVQKAPSLTCLRDGRVPVFWARYVNPYRGANAWMSRAPGGPADARTPHRKRQSVKIE